MKTIHILTVAILVCTASQLCAQVDIPAAINYQGHLAVPSTGQPVDPGVYHVEFRIWGHPTSTDAGYAIWGRSFPVHVVTNGLFNILLSDDGGELSNPAPLTNDIRQAFMGADRYLGLRITQTPAGSVNVPEISPRQRLVSAPYAMHAQNSTEAYHAETADEATLAQDAEKLAGKDAAVYYDNDRFDALGLHTSYLSILAWQDGGTIHKTSLYDYWGSFYMGGTPSAPPGDVRLQIDNGKLLVSDGLEAQGPIIPAGGTNTESGIRFPNDPGGGSGDKAYVTYAPRTGEECSLKVAVENDPTDNLELHASGTIEMHGKVSAFGGLFKVADLDSQGENHVYENHPDSDGFYYVYSDACEYYVTLGGTTWRFRTVHDQDWNIHMQTFPVAKGEYFKVHYTGNFDHDTQLDVFWRPFGL